MVDTWLFGLSHDQCDVTRLENGRQLNIRSGKKLGFLRNLVVITTTPRRQFFLSNFSKILFKCYFQKLSKDIRSSEIVAGVFVSSKSFPEVCQNVVLCSDLY